jgi:Resolvase, N terminal domain
MARPTLQRLVAAVGEGKVDVVMVYKVDRLTSSLADFAKIVELFDSKIVSFVSVMRQFNITSSMGLADAQCLCPVRAAGHERALPRQDRGLEEEGPSDTNSRTGRSWSTLLRPTPYAGSFTSIDSSGP